jgi:hypothetical protein
LRYPAQVRHEKIVAFLWGSLERIYLRGWRLAEEADRRARFTSHLRVSTGTSSF